MFNERLHVAITPRQRRVLLDEARVCGASVAEVVRSLIDGNLGHRGEDARRRALGRFCELGLTLQAERARGDD